MRLARVVGNVVSTVQEKTHFHYKLLIVDYLDGEGKPVETQQIVFDGADAGIGDLVLVNVDGGATKMLLKDDEIIADWTICGVLDHYMVDGETIYKPE